MRQLDGEDFLRLYDNIPRIRAIYALMLMECVAAGMNGGDGAQATMDSYTRTLHRLPKVRMKASTKAGLAAMGIHV